MRKKQGIYRKLITFMFYFSIMFLLAFSVAITKLKSENDIAHIFGIGLIPIEQVDVNANSSHDILVVKLLSVSEKRDLNASDVVSYYDLQTHEFTKQVITSVHEFNGEIYYTTQLNETSEMYRTVSAAEVSSVELTTIRGLGGLLDFLLTAKGFALGILLPVVIIWILESMILVNHLLYHHRRKLEKEFDLQALLKKEEVENEFEAIRKQLLKNFNLE